MFEVNQVSPVLFKNHAQSPVHTLIFMWLCNLICIVEDNDGIRSEIWHQCFKLEHHIFYKMRCIKKGKTDLADVLKRWPKCFMDTAFMQVDPMSHSAGFKVLTRLFNVRLFQFERMNLSLYPGINKRLCQNEGRTTFIRTCFHKNFHTAPVKVRQQQVIDKPPPRVSDRSARSQSRVFDVRHPSLQIGKVRIR